MKNMDENRDTALHRVEIGRLKVMKAVNRKLYRVEIWALNDRVNRNGWKYVNLESHLSEFQDIPILTAYLRNGQVIGDGHNFDMRTDPKTGEQYASFTAPDAERIVGWVPKDANIRIETEGETNWVVVTGYLWTWYARELVEKIAGQGGGMEVSIETLVTREHKEDGYDVEEEYYVMGVTVLGDGVAPAVAGANIQSLAALRDSMKTEILKAASYIGEIDPPAQESKEKTKTERMKSNMIPTMRQLQEAGKAFEGYTCVGLSEDGKIVALLSAQNAPFAYAYNDSDKGNVIAERIKSASAVVTFHTEDGEAQAALDHVMQPILTRANEAEERCSKLESDNKELCDRIEAMEKRENARRLSAAQAAVKDELDKQNASALPGVHYEESLCDKLMERINNNEFTGMVDKEGNWIGEQAVRDAVKILCMDETNRVGKAEKAKELHYHSWSKGEAKQNEAATIGDRLRANAANE